MPYIIATSVYPTDKVKEVVEKYFEALQKFPLDENLETEVVPVASKTTKKGVKTMSIGEVKEGKLEKALARAGSTVALFYDIVGFECTIDVYSTAEEGFAALGVS
ncbi:MAG: hypothetical protein H8D67_10465, partial [Deltaproteobacteria bacterium]|nr:hypothetical protein [Deltaproteobacteria bacterium]